MIRHIVLFKWDPSKVTPEGILKIKEGMSYIWYASEIQALDYGEDLGLGAGTHDLALSHDHKDRLAWDAYNVEPNHHRVGEFIKTVTDTSRVARVDWHYDGPPARRHLVRDTALYVWKEGVEEKQKAAVREGLASLRTACPTIRSLEFGDDLRWYPPNHEWIYEAHFDDVDGLSAFLAHPAQQEVAALIDSLVKTDLTARVQHRMMSG